MLLLLVSLDEIGYGRSGEVDLPTEHTTQFKTWENDNGVEVLFGEVCGEGDSHRLRVAQWPESIVIFLPCSVPKAQVDRLSVDHNISAEKKRGRTGEGKRRNSLYR